ncbi:MAG: hypothetical protein HY811_04465 [Planctomycetes bacterium]|nr:hypothetical protein [Planctomycetota bacterium]
MRNLPTGTTLTVHTIPCYPFIHKVDDKGTLWLYSLGENMVDNNGDQAKDIVISPIQ